MQKSALVIFAEGFEEIEAVSIVDTLRRADCKVTAAGLDSISVTGSHQIEISMDTVLSDIESTDFDLLVLPGGLPGSEYLRDSLAVRELIQEFDQQEKLIGAICAAPIALHAAGVLSGRNVTAYPAKASVLEGCNYTAARVEVDGHIITGAGAGTALEFSLALLNSLGLADKAEALHKAMLVKN